jgi:hypothetical protein
MTDIHRVVDPYPALKETGLDFNAGTRMFIDSTFVRFWSDSPAAEEQIRRAFGRIDWGRILEPAELAREGVDFADGRYGDLFVLADPGVLICPSFMGRSPLRGMHGYTPDDPASDAVLLRSGADPEPPVSILDLRRLFRSEWPTGGRPS